MTTSQLQVTEEAVALRTQVAEGDAALQALVAEKESLTENFSEQMHRATLKEEAAVAASEEAVARARAEAEAEARAASDGEVTAVPGVVWEGWLEKMGRQGDLLGRVSALVNAPAASRYQWRYVLVSDNVLQVWTPPVDARSKKSSFPGRFLRVVTGKIAAKARNWAELSHKLTETGFECKVPTFVFKRSNCPPPAFV